MEIRMITKAEADDIIATREPRGLFYLDTGKSFVGIDNSTGYAWTEEFDTLPKCRAWLLQEADSGPEPRTYVVTEQCANCEREVEIHGWDTERDGYQAFCPYCGEVLMLCDECQHSEQRQPCDFDADTGLCRHRRRPEGATHDVP